MVPAILAAIGAARAAAAADSLGMAPGAMIGPALPGTEEALVEKTKQLVKYLRAHGRDYNVPLPGRAADSPNSGDSKDLELGNKHE